MSGAHPQADRAFVADAIEPSSTVSTVPASIPCADKIERTWMKEPCGPCPFSRSKTLWLRPERAEDFAYMAQNPYSDFPCHKTAVEREDYDGGSEFVRGGRSLTCNGFLSLQVNENDNAPDGFEPHPDAFGDAWEMIDCHTEHWEDEERARDERRNGRDAKRLEAKPASPAATPCAQTNTVIGAEVETGATSDAPNSNGEF